MGTKEQMHQLFKKAAENGKLLIWYSTEDEELVRCSRVLIAIVILLSLMLTRTRYGKCLTAVGQNLDAARLTGMPVNLIQGIAYVLCSTLAAFGGIMISAQVNGAFLGLGDPYLLQTVGSVVVGGTLIFGGRAVPLGTLLGSLFLVLLVTAMQVAGLKVGGQFVAEGFSLSLLFSSRPKEFDSNNRADFK